MADEGKGPVLSIKLRGRIAQAATVVAALRDQSVSELVHELIAERVFDLERELLEERRKLVAADPEPELPRFAKGPEPKPKPSRKGGGT